MTKSIFLILTINIVCATALGQASPLPARSKSTLVEATPSSAGYSAERLKRIDQTIQEYVDKKWIAGATAMIVHDGKIVYYKGIGYDDNEKKIPVKRDAIFRIASQTKAITSTAVMIYSRKESFYWTIPSQNI